MGQQRQVSPSSQSLSLSLANLASSLDLIDAGRTRLSELLGQSKQLLVARSSCDLISLQVARMSPIASLFSLRSWRNNELPIAADKVKIYDLGERAATWTH